MFLFNNFSVLGFNNEHGSVDFYKIKNSVHKNDLFLHWLILYLVWANYIIYNPVNIYAQQLPIKGCLNQETIKIVLESNNIGNRMFENNKNKIKSVFSVYLDRM